MEKKYLFYVMAGAVATFVMAIIMYPIYKMGISEMNFPEVIGKFWTGVPAETGSSGWWRGVGLHLLMGVLVVPALYRAVFLESFSKNAGLKGTLWGSFLWLVHQVIASPLLGQGLFGYKTMRPLTFLVTTLVVYLVYGLVFSAIVERESERKTLRLERSEQSAA